MKQQHLKQRNNNNNNQQKFHLPSIDFFPFK